MLEIIQEFKQSGIIELGLNGDDLNVLRWFLDFKDAGYFHHIYDKNESSIYYWVSYSDVIKFIPYLFNGIKTYDLKKSKVQRIFNKRLSKILKKKVIKNENGTFVCFAIIESSINKLIQY